MQYATRPSDMYAAIIILSGLGYALNRGMRQVEGRLLSWQMQMHT